MAVQGKLFGICNVVGQFRNVLLNRNTVPFYQASVRHKQTIEEKLGLPPKPKKPLTAYFRFMAEMRPIILQKNPGMKVKDLAKEMSKEWANVNDKVRQRLEEEFKKEMQLYTTEINKYEQMLTDADREEIKSAKIEIKETKEKRKLRKKKQELGKPKKPTSPFLMFMSENKEKRGNIPFGEWQKILSKEWEKLPEQEKTRYMTRYKKSVETYKRELQDWEEKMIRLGHIDLVRNQVLINLKPSAASGIGTPVRSRKHSEE